jgi:hypothetical protein
MDNLILEFLNRTSPDPVLSGMTVAESIIAPAAPEHAAYIIRTPSGGYRLGETMTSGADWSTVSVQRPQLAPGEQHIGMIHTHPGSATDQLAQSRMDIGTANRWARGGPFNSSYVVGPSGLGPYFGVILFQPSPAPGSLTTLLPVP